jgi:pimeloyl-ACP methyl ester carboxylesterase
MYYLFQLFYVLYQYTFLTFFYSRKILTKGAYSYETERDIEHANVYTTGNKSKKVILILSGSYQLTYDVYLNKLIYDLKYRFSDFSEKYDMIVFERYDKTSIAMYDDVADFVRHLDKEREGLDELNIIGFSAGGVVASHVMNRLKDCSFIKRIITYDSPWSVIDTVSSFENNLFYRIDRVFFWVVFMTYYGHYNYKEISDTLWKYCHIRHGATDIVELVKEIHNLDDTSVRHMTSFNTDQTPYTKIANIYCIGDPIVHRDSHDNYVKQHARSICRNIKNYEKRGIGHTSDMSYSTRYISQIIEALTM